MEAAVADIDDAQRVIPVVIKVEHHETNPRTDQRPEQNIRQRPAHAHLLTAPCHGPGKQRHCKGHDHQDLGNRKAQRPHGD